MPTSDDWQEGELRPLATRLRSWLLPAHEYRLTRTLLLSLLGLVYLFAFVGLLRQLDPLLGSHGLTPAQGWLTRVAEAGGGFWEAPSLFWLAASDGLMRACAWLGLLLSLLVVVGLGNAPIMLALWLVYGSFVHVGQHWFSFGWEIQLLETGFLAVFLAPPLDPRFAHAAAPPRVTLVLYRWLAFRIMLGAGLIKLRGDPCWTELTCLDFHFETQPIPNPLSPWFHHLPHAVHATGVLFNHVVELVLPWFVFGPRRARLVAGVGMLGFQLMLIVSGNLAFLNWLTLVPVVACFDDAALLACVPARVRAWVEEKKARAESVEKLKGEKRNGEGTGKGRGKGTWPKGMGVQQILALLFAVVVAWLSMDVVANLASSGQAMNRSFDALALVNTYGAFGSVGSVRYELVIEGTRDERIDANTRWLAYELPCKPGALARRPCVLGPYHLRFDWLIWFAAMREEGGQVPWMVHVVYKLLHGDRGLKKLFAVDPFPGEPPRYVRVRRFVYRFAPADSTAWWQRDQERPWLPPLSADNPELLAYAEAQGWPALLAP